MSRAHAAAEVPGPVTEVEALWYEPTRWPSWIDGFGHLAKLEGEWPHIGARLIWDSRPGGRGRVVERVVRYEPRVGQVLEVEDERLTATQSVRFEPTEGGTWIALELAYELKSGARLQALVDLFFIRRALADSMRRTLARFRAELAADRELLR
jgi:Polyketide cyclase / dehydrase and lipid transport.